MPKIPHVVRLVGTGLDHTYGHICAFFHGKEELAVLLPFFKEGLECGDKVIHITDPQRRTDYLGHLHGGVNVAAAQAAGQLEVIGWDKSYLQNDRFDQHAMLLLVQDVLSNSQQQGFPMTRLTANMEWALQDLPGVQDLVEYEARVNYILPQYHNAVV